MRSIYEIQLEIQRVNHHLNLLILEKKITLQALWSLERSSEILAEQVIEKMKK